MSDRDGKLSRRRLERIVDLFFEAGMLRRTPRSGYIFLGSGSEDVAQHSFRVAFMCFVLARMAGAAPSRGPTPGPCHALHEARPSDLNYMNQRNAEVDQLRAQRDAAAGTGVEEDITGLFEEFEARETPEARLAKDADQLDLLFNLKVELDGGNAFAREWIDAALGRLRTPEARAVADEMLETDHNRWWYGRVDRRWWVDRRDHGTGARRAARLRRPVARRAGRGRVRTGEEGKKD